MRSLLRSNVRRILGSHLIPDSLNSCIFMSLLMFDSDCHHGLSGDISSHMLLIGYDTSHSLIYAWLPHIFHSFHIKAH